MKVTIKREVEDTIDVDLPAFRDYAGLHKIISEEEYVEVMDNNYQFGIKKVFSAYMVKEILKKGKPLEESVFNNAKQNALSRLNRDLFIEATTPATEEDIREKLYDEREDRRHFEDNYDSSIHPLN